jgi:Tfp pilus assembly protein PilO
MKVSRREFTMLILLLCMGASYLLYAFVFSPMLGSIGTAQINLMNSQESLNRYQQTVAVYDLAKLDKDLQEKINSVEKMSEPLLPYIDDGQITAFVDQAARTQNIRIYKILFDKEGLYDTAENADAGAALTYPLKQAASAFRGEEVTQASASPDAPTGSGAPPELDTLPTVVNKLPVQIQLSGVTYLQIIGFVKQVEAEERAIYLTNLSITEATQVEGLDATLIYGFMQAEKPTDNDKGLTEVPAAQSAGNPDPFGTSASAAGQQQ